jgi:hypothetical protein
MNNLATTRTRVRVVAEKNVPDARDNKAVAQTLITTLAVTKNPLTKRCRHYAAITIHAGFDQENKSEPANIFSDAHRHHCRLCGFL